MKPGRGIFCPFRVNPRIFSGPSTRLSLSVSSPALLPSLFVYATVSCSSTFNLYQRLLRPFLLTVHFLSFVSSLRHFHSMFLVLSSVSFFAFSFPFKVRRYNYLDNSTMLQNFIYILHTKFSAQRKTVQTLKEIRTTSQIYLFIFCIFYKDVIMSACIQYIYQIQSNLITSNNGTLYEFLSFVLFSFDNKLFRVIVRKFSLRFLQKTFYSSYDTCINICCFSYIVTKTYIFLYYLYLKIIFF